MTYEELKIMMFSYRIGKISRIELEAAIGLWQRKEHRARWPVIYGVITLPYILRKRWDQLYG